MKIPTTTSYVTIPICRCITGLGRLRRPRHLESILAAVAFLAAMAGVRAQSTSSEKNDEVITLEKFEVTASSNVGYGATATGSSGRLSQSYIDTPQATTVVTSELMTDAHLFNTLEAVKFVPGVQANFTTFPIVMIRGLNTANVYVDGFFAGGTINMDTEFFDRVEVVKGPSPIAFGRGDPAGFLNFVTKRPLFANQSRASVMFGTGNDKRDNYRFTFDNNGFIGEKGDTAYRVVGVYSRGSGTRQFSEFERAGVLLAVTHKFGQRGDLSVVANLSRSTDPAVSGSNSFTDATFQAREMTQVGNTTPNVPLLPRDTVLAYDGATGMRQQMAEVHAVFQYQLSDHWKTRQAVRKDNLTKVGQVAVGNAGGISRRSDGVLMISIPLIQLDGYARNVSYQADFVGNYEIEALKAKLTFLAGGDVTWGEGATGVAVVAPPDQPLLNFNYSDPGTRIGNLDNSGILSKSTVYSPYLQIQSHWLDDRIHLSAAVRKIMSSADGTNRSNGSVTSSSTNSPLMPSYTLLVKPTKWLSVYAAASRHREPKSVVNLFASLPPGDPRAAEILVASPFTRLLEFGVKGNLWNDKVTFSLTRFDQQQSGSIGQVLVDPVLFIAKNYINDTNIKGWEFEIFGQPTKQLTFMVGGAFLDTDTLIPFKTEIRHLPLNVADTVYFNAKYDFSDSSGNGFSFQAGAKTYLKGYNAGSISVIAYPDDKTSVDLGATYAFGKRRYSVNLRANNVFNSKSFPTGVEYVIEGRLVYLTLSAKF